MGNGKYRYFAVYKPFGVLSQFTDPVGGKKTLGDLFDFPKRVYPVGRLDEDSEGLLLLTDDPSANARLLNQGIEKEYHAQVEGLVSDEALASLCNGIRIRIRKKDFDTRPALAQRLEPAPIFPERHPPIRFRKSVPESWISLTLTEGKNRQVRKMTAKVGFPTLRLVRVRIGILTLNGLKPGEVLDLSASWDWKNWTK